jgi:hypothetical protein
MDVGAAAAARQPGLRRPEPEPGGVADQVPVTAVAAFAVEGLLEAEGVAVEPAGGIEVRDLEDELGNSADGGRLGHAPSLT